MINVGLRAGCVWVQLHYLKGAYENLSGLRLDLCEGWKYTRSIRCQDGNV